MTILITLSNRGKSIENNKTLPGVLRDKCIKLKPAINSNKADTINIEDLMTLQRQKYCKLSFILFVINQCLG